MGATNFEASSRSLDAREAYAQAVKEAQYEHGHDGYNGTISTTDGFTIIQAEPVTIREYREIAKAEWAKEDTEAGFGVGLGRPRFEKFGNCCAVRVKDTKFDGWIFFGLAAV